MLTPSSPPPSASGLTRDDFVAILAAVEQGVTVQNSAGALVYANDAAAAMLGFPSAEALLGVDARSLVERFEIFDEQGARLSAADLPGRRALQSGGTFAQVMRFRSQGTGDRWARVCGRALRGQKGEIWAVNTFRDAPEIAERNERLLTAEQARREAEQARAEMAEMLESYARDIVALKKAEEQAARLARYTALRADTNDALASHRSVPAMLQAVCEAMVRHLDAAFARIWAADDQGTTLLLQASAGRYTHLDGPHRAVPVGQYKIGLIAQERRPYLSNDVPNDPRVSDQQWARREGMVAFAGYPLVVDQHLIGVVALFARAPLHDDLLSVLGAVADVIAQGVVRRRAEFELEERARDLARSNAELEQFAYVASHDLQEPLRMVASFNQLLARRYKGKLDADADEFISYTVEGVSRMQRLINDLLTYSRVGTRGLDLAQIDLNLVFAGITQNLKQTIDDERATVTHDPLPSVWGDEVQLSQLLQNLVSNAIKFHANRPPVVHVGARLEASCWCISVKDNGIGIDAQYFERIFVIFQRLHSREKYPGTGIGLAICKKIVERHGGKIWVESTPGEGSTISFSIPTLPRAKRSP